LGNVRREFIPTIGGYSVVEIIKYLYVCPLRRVGTSKINLKG